MRHLSARRTLSAALVLALGLSLAASCAQKQEEPEQTTGTGEANTYLSPATQSGQTEPTYDNTFTQAPNPIPTPNPTPDPTTITVNGSVGLTYQSNGNGTCTLTGIGSCTDACVVIPDQNASGDRVTAIGERALYGAASVAAVQIPASVTSIGSLAFAACPSLTFISVSTGNAAFKAEGGVLYSADGTRLIVYPAARADSACRISSAVRTIEPMAFYNCKNLRTIRYAGTQAQWATIAIGDTNYSLNAASILCTDAGK